MDDVVRLAQSGDRAAVERVLAEIAPAVHRFGRRMCGNAHDADDVVQDTLLNVALHLEPKVEGASPTAQPGCPDVLALWSRKLDGELRPVDCAPMEAHVAVCPSCRVACDARKQALLACRAVSTAVVPARVREQVKVATRQWADARLAVR